MIIMKKIMQDMPDKELDELFKTAADHVQYDFEQAAWQNLQHKMRGGSWWTRRGIFWGIGLLLILGTVFLAIWLNRPDKTVPMEAKNSALPASLTSIITPGQENTSQKKNQPSKNNIGESQTKKGRTIKSQNQKGQLINIGAPNIINSPYPVVVTPANVNKKTSANFISKTNKKTQTPNKKPGYRYKDIFNPVTSVTDNGKSRHKEEEKLGNSQINLGHKTGKGNSLDQNSDKNKVMLTPPRQMGSFVQMTPKNDYEKSTVLPPIAKKTAVLSANENQAQTISSPRKLSLIAQVAPDLSMVDGMSMGDTRLGFGLLVEYEVIKNLSIAAGANYSFKAYQASAESYTPQEGKWKWQTTPENIQGSCNVLEVPLNIRYYFHNQPTHRLFISTGVSSYWMLHEKYNFEYQYQSQLNYAWEVSNQNNHMLSILNVSIGWQKKLNQRFSIQIEPFFKAPLGKVGAGKVSLKTTGVLLGLKYDLF